MHRIHGVVSADVFQQNLTTKPYIRLKFPDGTVERITANIADMIGGIGRGALGRMQDMRGSGKFAFPPEDEDNEGQGQDQARH